MSRVARQAVNEYFDLLLTEPDAPKRLADVEDEKKADIQALLNRSMPQADTLTTAKAKAEPRQKTEEKTAAVDNQPRATKVETPPQQLKQTAEEISVDSALPKVSSWRDELDDPFQCLFFQFAELTVAVPLHLLGGIRELGKLAKVPGNPSWIMGIQSQHGENLKVVDSQSWLMPERATADVDYRYLVQLGQSDWAFACEALVDAEPLRLSEVKWRATGSEQRRHLAGIVRERMCVVLDVTETIALLDAGMNITLEES